MKSERCYPIIQIVFLRWYKKYFYSFSAQCIQSFNLSNKLLRLPQIKNLEGKRWIVGFQIMKWTKKFWASYTLSQKSELPDVFKSLFSKPRAFHPYIFVQIYCPSWMRHFVFPFCKDASKFFNAQKCFQRS